jgi:hypothetical protein
MTRDAYLKGLGATLAFGLAAGLVLRLVAGERWFSFYGWAAVALLTLPLAAYYLWTRLPVTGRSKWRTLLYVVPVLLIALVQIGYWTVFFTYGPQNATIGVVREVMLMNAGFALPWLYAGLAALFAWLFYSAAGPDASRT